VRPESDMARFSVKDTGIGLEGEETRAVFEPYRQGRKDSRGGGLGLGLTLVKGLVEAHGGTVGVQSEGPGRGCLFTFTIPLARNAPLSATPADIVAPRSLRVLVVDDQRDVADMFATFLETLGQEVRVAYDGSAALALARKYRPEVAFLDVAMPDMSGAELAQQLRQAFPPTDLTLVAVTGHEREHAQVQRGQFDRHLLKPATAESVVAILSGVTQPASRDKES
jgi:CheY-like chemotaxis protein